MLQVLQVVQVPEEQHRLGVEEDGVDVLVAAWRVLRGGRHLEGPQETRDQDLELLHVPWRGEEERRRGGLHYTTHHHTRE